ncbi:YaaC family protein [Priestia abyssalis]|uniref:YaaC family protein n=1 Tax=Priestia abyssalis TaxID=1221450 RepID=UPI0009955FF3|nr:YaaC family protein [Priestia abyssalis]
MFNIPNIKDSFSIFYSAPYSQKYLYSCYESHGLKEAEKKSYENCYPFIYYLEHSQNYYNVAHHAPLAIKPMLLFYGMTQLLKACLLTVDFDYPHSTSVLAHGVSTRKRKKQSYDFLDDEVKIQKYGLFSHISRVMFHVEQIEGSKYSMFHLLSLIPELSSLFEECKKHHTCVQISTKKENIFQFPISILEHYHVNTERFCTYLLEKTKLPFQYKQTENKHLIFQLDERINLNYCSPLMFNFYDKEFFFPLQREKSDYFPEILSHYLLLYNLSMISRYETEWWYELLHTYSSNDFSFISKFLSVSSEKIPFLLYDFLQYKKS